MTLCYLNDQSLTKICYVSREFRNLAQPLIFRRFDSGLYDQRGLWKRLSLLAEALENRPSLGQEMAHISVKLWKLEHVENLAQLLLPILSKATRLCSLSLPIHAFTAELLRNPAVGFLKTSLDVREAFAEMTSLNNIELARGPIHYDQPDLERGLDGLQLQVITIGACRLEYRSTVKLLQSLQNLKCFGLFGVELWDPEFLSCGSKVAGILGALNSSRHTLTDLALDVRGTRDPDIEKSEIASFEPFGRLQNLIVHEYDLTRGVVTFPASLIRLCLYQLDILPNFPFFENRAEEGLPRFISSCSRNPNILQQKLKETQPPWQVKVHARLYNDNPPKYSLRRPEDPSY